MSEPDESSGSASHGESRPGEGPAVEVFWRPGCVFCVALRADLALRGIAAKWVDIWEDDDAAAFVRSVNSGNEVVPTVRVGGHVRTNPSGRDVAALLAAATTEGGAADVGPGTGPGAQ